MNKKATESIKRTKQSFEESFKTEDLNNMLFRREKHIEYRELEVDEVDQALGLVWQVFFQYEASDYSKDGIDEFEKSIHDPQYLSTLQLYGAFKNNEIIGVIATRSKGTHIALFFVNGKYHRQGIGKQLFQMTLKDCPSNKMTVNSSPYAIQIYHKLGFYEIDKEQVVNGLRFTPMEFML